MSRSKIDLVIECLIMVTVAVFILFVFTRCGSAPSVPESLIPPKYELTLSGSLDGSEFTGISMGSKSPHHEITISSTYEVNYFIAKTCHRSEKHEDIIDQGWFSETKSWRYVYNEAPTIEDTGDCPLRICVYSKTVGAPPVQCAVIDFKNDRYQMIAENICNGADGITSGKMLCHTQSGLIERVRFKEPMFVAPPVVQSNGEADKAIKYTIPDQCEGKFLDAQNTLFQYIMPDKECYLIFDTVSKPHRRAKLTAIPYNVPQYTGGH